MLVGIDKFFFPIDFIVLDMPEDSKTSLILGRPFLSTTHAKIDVFKRKNALKVRNDKIVFKSNNLASHIIMKVYVLGLKEQTELDLEARIMGEALILNRPEDPDFGDFIELNDLNEPLELRNHDIEDLVVENMYAYSNKDMSDVIFGKPFCTSAYVEVSNGNDRVTYQMARSHPRFKHISNEQCNKIRPLLQVITRDKLEGKSHPYQLLKDFYKGVLDLGPEYIKNEKTVEWLTDGHVSIYEMDRTEGSLA
ncbi:homeodomain-like protein [Tanacetum coccineum]